MNPEIYRGIPTDETTASIFVADLHQRAPCLDQHKHWYMLCCRLVDQWLKYSSLRMFFMPCVDMERAHYMPGLCAKLAFT